MERRELLKTVAVEPKTESLLKTQVHIKGTSNLKALSWPTSCLTQT